MCYYNGQYFRAIDGTKAYDRNGELVLVSPYTDTLTCAGCGKEFVDDGDYTVDIDGKIICEECESEYGYEQCSMCGRWERLNDMKVLYEGYSHRQDGYVCDDCVENGIASKCDCCGRYVRQTYSTEDGYELCEYCNDNETHYCDRCHCTFYDDDAGEWDEEGEYWYCNNCSEAKVIHNYSYKPAPVFLKMHDEVIQKEYFGFEIEVGGDTYKADTFLSESGNTGELYLKRDGSVDGFEIVTHPMSRDYFYKSFMPQFEKGLTYLRRNNFRGHNNGGIHIHVSREVIDEDMLKKMVILLYPKTKSIKQKWLVITQRREQSMDRWACMDEDSIGLNKKYVIKEIEAVKQLNIERQNIKRNVYFDGERYTAINTKNDHTIEFRIFNSNIRPERIIKNAEVIFSLIDFCKTDKMPTMGNYLGFIRDNKSDYQTLYDFLLEKRVIQTPEQREQALSIARTASEVSGIKIAPTEVATYLQTLNIVPDFREQNTDNESILTTY